MVPRHVRQLRGPRNQKGVDEQEEVVLKGRPLIMCELFNLKGAARRISDHGMCKYSGYKINSNFSNSSLSG